MMRRNPTLPPLPEPSRQIVTLHTVKFVIYPNWIHMYVHKADLFAQTFTKMDESSQPLSELVKTNEGNVENDCHTFLDSEWFLRFLDNPDFRRSQEAINLAASILAAINTPSTKVRATPYLPKCERHTVSITDANELGSNDLNHRYHNCRQEGVPS